MKCRIVGLSNVGKTTHNNCLSDSKVQLVYLPFYTKKSNTGIITVPDERLAKLAKIDKPQRVIPVTVDIINLAGLDEPAAQQVIRAANKLLDLQTFFRTGKDESHAWTYRKGIKAPVLMASYTVILKGDISALK